MATFSVSIDLAEHEYSAAGWPAQHHFVCGVPDDVKQQIGSSPARGGRNHHTAPRMDGLSSTTIGSWSFDPAHETAAS